MLNQSSDADQGTLQPQTGVESLLIAKGLSLKLKAAIVAGVAICASVFHVYTAAFTMIDPYAQRTFCLALCLVLGFLIRPLGRESWRSKLNKWFALDLTAILLVVANCIYVIWDYDAFYFRTMTPTTLDAVFGTIMLVLSLELARRFLGWAMVGVAAFLLIQNFTGPYLPGILHAPPLALKEGLSALYMGVRGLYGLPIGVLTAYLALFMVFVAFLQVSGAATLFLNLALSIAGRWRGGPAKVSLFASGLMGTMVGSDVANVAATGSFTIPMMKRIGYKPHFAGAVEAVSSNGGQFVPPIMGMTAFLIAEFLGLPYFYVCLAALIPMLLYYTAVFMQIHFEAVKTGLKALPPEECPPLRPTLLRSWPILVPILLLFVFLALGYNVAAAGFYALVAVIVCTSFNKETRLNPVSFLVALEQGGKQIAFLGAACAACGIIIGSFLVSGLGDSISAAILSASGGQLWIALLITAGFCIILGMGVPTPIVYVTVYMFAIPTLIKMGVVPLAASFFAFYFGVLSSITPPVCLAAVTAAGIAQTGYLRTGFTAMRLGIAAYFIPFLFVFAPALILEGPITETLLYLATGLVGVAGLAIGVEGWLFRETTWIERILFFAGGVCLMIPSIPTDLAGIGMLAVGVLLQRMRHPKPAAG